MWASLKCWVGTPSPSFPDQGSPALQPCSFAENSRDWDQWPHSRIHERAATPISKKKDCTNVAANGIAKVLRMMGRYASFYGITDRSSQSRGHYNSRLAH